jgi:DNA-binding HxlR family transcriptional regulator
MGGKMRSGCPVSLGLDIFGDRWTLLVIRDLMFGGKRHFREILSSDEGISSNILADRLKLLLDEGLVTKADDPGHQQKAIYSLTEKGIALLPILMEISRWSYRYRPVGETYLPDGNVDCGTEPVWERMMKELRRDHIADA